MRCIVLLALVGAAMAVPKNPSRIVGGEATTIETYPYMSSMLYKYWGIFLFQACGGSLITPSSILSAAHCFEGDRASDWSVRLGSTLASSGGTVFDVAKLVSHEGYNRNTIDNDIAIVQLAVPAVLSNTIGTARIAGPNYNLPDGTKLTTIGWGAISSGGPSSETLQHVDVDIINQDLCAERYAQLKAQPGYQNWPDILPGMVCVGILDVGGKDACQGDSGGPLSHDLDILYGVVSWGFGCAHSIYPGVNTRISSYTDWIMNNHA